jgi:hypothetical protein
MAKHTTFFLWFSQAVLITILCGTIYVAVQQDLRQSANDPQIQMAEDSATVISGGGNLNFPDKVDIGKSLSPFVMVFDASGNEIQSQALLDGVVPHLPPGVFDSVRSHGEDRFTWQPRPGVRIAAVVTNYTGQTSGFVLAGRSLREVEKREDQLTFIVELAWISSMLVLVIAFFLTSILFKSTKK